jgi:hypothetical protein
MTEKRQTSQGYIYTTFRNETSEDFVMLFQASCDEIFA